MAQKTLDLFGNKFVAYQQKAIRGLFVDVNNEFVKISPADYTGAEVGPNNCVVQKRDVYDAIVLAQEEAKVMRLVRQNLPLGVDTHSVKLRSVKLGLYTSYKIDLILDLNQPKIELQAFKNLVNKYKIYYFPLGRVPFHNNAINNAMGELTRNYKHARISSVFARKRDNYPRIYVGVTMNDFMFNIRSSTIIDLHDEDDIDSINTSKPNTSNIELDL